MQTYHSKKNLYIFNKYSPENKQCKKCHLFIDKSFDFLQRMDECLVRRSNKVLGGFIKYVI